MSRTLFRLIPHVAVQVKDIRGAEEFYTRVLGLDVLDREPQETRFTQEGFNLYLEQNTRGDVFLALEISGTLADAKHILEESGCKVYATTERGFMIKDPFGLNFYVSLPE